MNVLEFLKGFLEFWAHNRAQVSGLSFEHLWLVGISMLLAVLIGLPLGVLVTRHPRWNRPILGSANVVQTIPSLALFGFLLPAPGLGERADRLAIAALTLYALLPITQNTCSGILGVDPDVREAARGMGMTDRQMLFQVELPLLAIVPWPGQAALAVVLAEMDSRP